MTPRHFAQAAALPKGWTIVAAPGDQAARRPG
jgi:uncharacterized protein YbdZ (MbtH family)